MRTPGLVRAVLIALGGGRRRELERANAHLAAVVESSDDAIFSMTLDGVILTWNAGAERLYGYTAAEVVGRPQVMLVPPERPAWVPETVESIRRGERVENIESVRLRKDGSRFYAAITLSPVRDASGGVVGVSSIGRDITARKELETRLRAEAELLNLTYDALFMWELDGGITYWNRGAEELYGFSRDEAIGRASRDLLQTVFPGDPGPFVETLTGTGRWEGELGHVTKDGRVLTVDTRMRLIERDGRRLVLETTRDVTERRRAHEAEQAQRRAAEQAAERIGWLQAITAGLATALTPQQVAGVIIEHARPIIAATGAFLMSLTPDRQTFEMVGGVGLPEEILRRWKSIRVDAPGSSPEVVLTGSVLYFESREAFLRRYPHLRDEEALIPAMARAVLPLTTIAGTVGALTFFFPERHGFTGEERGLLETVAQQCAQALERAQLHQMEREARRAAEQAANRTARLQTVTAALSRAVTPGEVAAVILEQGAAALGAEAGAVYVLDADESALELLRHVNYPDEVMQQRQRLPLTSATPLAECVRAKQPIYMESAAGTLARYPATLGQMHPFAGARAFVPMVVRGRRIGALTFIFRGTRAFAAADREFLQTLGDQCAQAFERARLYARERHAAATLQQALLPGALPHVPGVTIDAAYRAGTPGAEVGGDWYDAFRLPDGRVVVAIGDVVGRGLEAAVAMGQVRQAIRAAAMDGRPPAEIFTLVNRLLPFNAAGERDTITAIVGVLDWFASSFTYAAAGHPAPLLAGPDGVAPLPSGGLPLGFIGDAPAPSWTIDLAPGSLLVLYTDGVVESRRRPLEGLAALQQSVDAVRGEPAVSPAQAILDRLDLRDASDDIAIVTLAVEAKAADRLDVTLPAEPGSLRLVRQAFRHFARGLALDGAQAFALTIALGEAVNNVIEHAYGVTPGTVTVRAWREGDTLRLEIVDRGRWRPPRSDGRGGRGVSVMRALTGAVEVARTAEGTTVRLSAPLPRARPAGEAGGPARPSAVSPVDETSAQAAGPAAQEREGRGEPFSSVPEAVRDGERDGRSEDGAFAGRLVGGFAVLDVTGDVDMVTVERFAEALEGVAARAEGPVIVSVAGADYFDSHGVRALFQFASRLQTNRRALFVVAPAEATLRHMLDAAGLGAFCPVVDSLDRALHLASQPAT